MESTYRYLYDYLRELQAQGRYAVTFTELKNRFNSSGKAIQQSIYRLKRDHRLAQVRKEFYVIVPPQYSKRGMIPPSLFLDDLMQFLHRDYYIALFSAAALHGAGHQQPMGYQVIINKPPIRNIKNSRLNIQYFVKSQWNPDNILKIKSETGYIKVSSPALTAFDMVHYHKNIGGFNRIITILEDLLENIKTTDLIKSAADQKVPDTQRLGYLLEQLGHNKLATSIYKKIEREKMRVIPLSLAHKNREGESDQKWNVTLNNTLDI